jgi:1,4-dihydroxy-2-naphthoate octaprenyltransferase
VLVAGLLPQSTALFSALAMTGFCCVQTALLPIRQVQIISLLGLALAWAYTCPPLALSYRGFGEVTVTFVLNILAPLYGYALSDSMPPASGSPHFMQLLHHGRTLAPLLAPLALVNFSRMMIMNMADMKADACAGKWTFPSQIGMIPSIVIVFTLRVLAVASALALTWYKKLPWTVGALFIASFIMPVHFKVIRCLRVTYSSKNWQANAPAYATQHNAVASIAYLLGWIFSRGFYNLDLAYLCIAISPVLLWLVVATRLPANLDAMTLEEVVRSPRFNRTPRIPKHS